MAGVLDTFRLDGRTALVTGGNRGLGAAFVLALAQAGAKVALVARDAKRNADVVAEVAAQGHDVLAIDGDITSGADIDRAVAPTVAELGGLDVLVNNAGIESRTEDNGVIGAAEVTAEAMRETFETNVFGVVRVTHAFLPLLRRSAAPVVVNVGSGLGSLARLTDPDDPAYGYPGVAYPASKATVNALTTQYAKAFPQMRINVVEPGFTATDLNGHSGVQTVEEGAEIIVRMATIGPDGPTGGYFDAAGPLAW
jgi:NAD(P)-dependent dehydrogenase (short-subunit alcohol dehydrogenase family)